MARYFGAICKNYVINKNYGRITNYANFSTYGNLLKRANLSDGAIFPNYANFNNSKYANFSSYANLPLKESYVYGISEIPLTYKTIGQILEERAEKFGNKTVFVLPHQKIRKTYANFYQDVQKLANGLIVLGLNKGDRVGMWGPNSYEWLVAQYATAEAGLIFVTINPAYSARELEFCLHKAGVKCLISADHFKKRQYYDALCEIFPGLLNVPNGNLNFGSMPNLKSIIFIGQESKQGTWSYGEVCEMKNEGSKVKLDELRKQIQPDDPVNLQFTSGTTGAPKGATLTHFNIVNNAMFVGRRLGYHEQESIICCPPPLYHCLACVFGSLSTVVHGASCVFPYPSFNAEATLKAIHDEKVTSIYGTPTMYIDLLNHPNFGDYNYSSLKTGIITGSPCPSDLCEDIVEKMGVKELTIVYGTTENSPATFQTPRTMPWAERLSTVGHVLDHTEAKIVDEQGQIVPVTLTGELMIRGYCLMLNYWQDPEKTKEVIGPDRWYKTGDLAQMDQSGCVKIVGRKKDMIIRGGENIYPVEIEQFLHTYDHVTILDVQVFGVPDQRLGEEVCAWIRLKEGQWAKKVTENDIRQFCKGKIAHYKIPRYIMFKREDQFPITVTGKIEKYKMRQMAIEELKLNFDKK